MSQLRAFIADYFGKGAAVAPPTTATAVDLSAWQAARNEAVKDLKALAAKVAGTRHAEAIGVLNEINGVIAKLPVAPKPQDVDKLEDFIRTNASITAAEKSPSHFHDLNIRQPLLEALESLRQ